MAKMKYLLDMDDGVVVADIDELKEHYNEDKAVEHFRSGRLLEWLTTRFYDEEAEAVEQLSADDPKLAEKLGKIFGIEVESEDDPDRAERLEKLRRYTSDQNMLAKVDQVAFDQSELGDLLNDGCNEIFLCGSNTFRIPLRMKNKKYIGIGEGGVNVKVMPPDKVNELESFGIAFKNVIINGKHVSSLGAVETSKKSSAPERDRNSESSFREIEPSSKSSTVDSDELFELGCSSLVDKKDPAVALKYFKQAEKLGSAAAVNMIGEMYEQGWGVEADLYKAMEYFRRAADAGDIDALLNLADHYRSGDGVKQDSRKALELYKRAAAAGDDDAMNKVGLMYDDGEIGSPDPYEAMDWYRKAADAGNIYALSNMAGLYRFGNGVRQDVQKALELFKMSADAGNSVAMNRLGLMYYNGEVNNEPDPYEAMRWFRKAADAGNVDALSNMADMYYSGDGVRQDKHKAFELLKQAADAGNVDALSNMAYMYYSGDGVRQDKHKAFELYKQAADAGNIDALSNMAFLYRFGEGVEKNDRKAFELFKKAAEADHADAMENLGEMFLNGEGVAQDIERGRMWIEKSIELGNDHALIALGDYWVKKRDFQEAFKCYREAFERTQAGVAAYYMMLIYKNGLLGETDMSAAKYWANKALENGYDIPPEAMPRDDGKGKPESDSKCFITTAVCAADGKPDDCFELTTFRSFRDGWLVNQSDGKSLIDRYYEIAPKIVAAIEQNTNSAEIYRGIRTEYLEPCLQFIARNNFNQCKDKYIEMVRALELKYL